MNYPPIIADRTIILMNSESSRQFWQTKQETPKIRLMRETSPALTLQISLAAGLRQSKVSIH